MINVSSGAYYIIPTLVLLSLSGCLPYGGIDKQGTPCLVLKSPVGIMMDGIEQPECSAKRVPIADESTKRVKYSESQRLAMAEEAARIFYPLNDSNKFKLAHIPARRIVYDNTNKEKGHSSDECDFMIVVHDLAEILKNELPDEKIIYGNIAKEWSTRYGDDQLDMILKTAQTNGDTHKLGLALKPQLPVIPGDIISAPRFDFNDFIKSNSAKYTPYVKQHYAEIHATNRFVEKQYCKRMDTDTVTGDYAIVAK